MQLFVNTSSYGLDVTFPVHHFINESHSPLHAYFYQKYSLHMQGCYRYRLFHTLIGIQWFINVILVCMIPETSVME